jgi:hypothetical protein
MKRLMVFLALGLAVFSTAGFAADRDDIYLSGSIGVKAGDLGLLDFGGVLGYVPADSLGLGLGLSQSSVFKKSQSTVGSLRTRLELRWFLEPFELAASGGFRFESSDSRTGLLAIHGAYLIALTPSLSFKLESYAETEDRGRSSVWVLGGVRVLY